MEASNFFPMLPLEMLGNVLCDIAAEEGHFHAKWRIRYHLPWLAIGVLLQSLFLLNSIAALRCERKPTPFS